MKNILLSTHSLKNYAGSEINILELAKTFILLELNVEVATFEYDYPIRDEFEQSKIRVVNLFNETLSLKNYDLIWSQHAPVLNYILCNLKIRSKHIIHSSLSTYEPLETSPVYFDKYISMFLANSEETKKSILEKGLDEKKIQVFKNFVLDEFFNYERKEYKGINRLLLVSNHIPEELLGAIKTLKKNNTHVDIIGRGYDTKLITPDILLKYDAVVTIGKTVQYALALGLPVFCYDRFGGDGWISIENINESEKFNFSGRYLAKKESPQKLCDTIINKKSFHDRDKLCDIAKDRYSLSLNLKELIDTIKQGEEVSYTNFDKEFDVLKYQVPFYKRLFDSTIELKNNDALKNNAIKNKNELIKEKDDVIKDKNSQIDQRDDVIKDKNSQIEQRDDVIKDKNSQIEQRDDVIKDKNSQIVEIGNARIVSDNKNKELIQNIKELKQQLYKKEQDIKRLNDLAQSLRLKNRLKRLLFLDEKSPIIKTLKSLKNDGLKRTIYKIKNKLFSNDIYIKSESTTLEPVNYINNMSEIKKIVKKNYINILKDQPLVSILVLTRDGLVHIKRLFKAIKENTVYENFEIIVVDNASSDDTIEFLENNEYGFDLKIIKNSKNETFSYANNQAARMANGEYLLLLNNDIEPLRGWMTHLVEVMQTQENVGSVGSQLIYPYDINEPFSTKVQHSGIAFRHDYIEELKLDFFRPYNLGMGKNPVVKNSSLNIGKRLAVTAACLMVKKDVYFEVDGLDEGYNYGYEDVDFGLKLHEKGYDNYYSQNSILFHYESSTQKLESQKSIKGRRVDNINLLHFKWHGYIKKHYFFEKFKNKNGLFSEKKLKIAFAVTEAGENAVAGDYFTALELADSFKEIGYETTFLRRRGGDWYNIPKDVDVVVSMLDAYDLTEIKDKSKNLITAAWIRNWPDRWLENKSFSQYDLIFASSQTLCDMISEKSGKDVTLFPIATTPEKFTPKENIDKSFSSDYSFTGNYWGKPREIETFLNPSELKYKFNIYGKDWNLVEKFKEYHKGFLNYKDIPRVYANSKVTIDDAVVGITKPYGSVNSRVFDAIAGGTLVVTNGVVGAKETFGDLLPVYETKEELHGFLEEYLSSDSKREERVKQLQEFVFNNHTYRIRAQLMKQKLEKLVGIKKSVAIKMPIPNWNEAKTWGDYHLALGLQKQFEKLGYYCILQVLPEWENAEGNACDIVLVLRGLSLYKVKKHQLNLMWNISHPDKVSNEEYNSYDTVFVSSDVWAEHLKKNLNTKVEVMHQCTDINIFKPYTDDEYKHQLLFIGNSRNIFRKSLQYLLPTKYELAVFGTLWEKFIDKKYIKGLHVDNRDVYKYYSNADIVLNDHWDSMQENGFISNRIFDVMACNGFILTDQVKGLEELFGDSVITYESKTDLEDKIDYYLNNVKARKELAKKGRDLVLEKHTYKNRVEQILSTLNSYKYQ